MREELRIYIENLFTQLLKTGRIKELKDELLSNVTEKYNDLLAQGRSEQEAYNTAIASIGDVNALLKGLELSAQMEPQRRRSALFVSAGVGLYVIAGGVFFLFSMLPGLRLLGLSLTILIAAIATATLVYNVMSRPKLRATGAAEGSADWKRELAQKRQIYKAITSASWPLVVVIYFVISFFFGGWAYTWLIFLICAAFQNILKSLFGIRKKG